MFGAIFRLKCDVLSFFSSSLPPFLLFRKRNVQTRFTAGANVISPACCEEITLEEFIYEPPSGCE